MEATRLINSIGYDICKLQVTLSCLRHKIEEQDRLLPPNYHELIAILEVNHLKIAADLELLKLEISLIVKR